MIIVSTIHHENNYQDIDLKFGRKRINFGGYRVDSVHCKDEADMLIFLNDYTDLKNRIGKDVFINDEVGAYSKVNELNASLINNYILNNLKYTKEYEE